MSLRFGTDGVRGDARTDLTPQAVSLLGRVGAEVLGGDGFAVGYDTRVSGPALSEALRRGVSATGGVPVDLGVVPTPAVARWCEREQVAGAMVSASHNPWHDNGVKFFARGGHKLSDDVQAEMESRLRRLSGRRGVVSGDAEAGSRLRRLSDGDVNQMRTGSSVEQRSAGYEASRLHIAAVIDSIAGRTLDRMHVVVDCANGAASGLAPDCLRMLGVRTETIHASPNGRNINDGCGSLHPASLQAAVLSVSADAGIAFDGDADRVIAVDHTGALIDGDQILALCAIDRHQRGQLRGNAVVITVMANLGLRKAMLARHIGIIETAVGDRNVLDGLATHRLDLGGEQSGHLVFRDLATTGDGLLTAVQLLDVVKRSGRRLADLTADAMTRLPQVLLGVAMAGSVPSQHLETVLAAVSADAADRLGEGGRVLVRPSGTEPVVRVMVEANNELTARSEAERVAAAVAAEVG